MNKLVIMSMLLLCACAGPKGDSGLTGSPGIPGDAGVGCTVSTVSPDALIAPNGGSLVVCGDSQSYVLNGSNGSNGTNEAAGSQGVPGTSISMVKFCANDNSAYPEYGFKVGDNIYAVYWDSSKGAFLTKVIPGSYMSTNGTGCTFVVNSNGSISP